MTSTMALLEKALSVKRAAEWTRVLNLDNSTFSQAKKRGRLSPTLAGTLAEQLHEDAARWMAVAALEAEPDGPLKERLLKKARTWSRALVQKAAEHWHSRTTRPPSYQPLRG